MAQRRAVTSKCHPGETRTHSRLYFSTPPPASLFSYIQECEFLRILPSTSKVKDLPSEELLLLWDSFSASKCYRDHYITQQSIHDLPFQSSTRNSAGIREESSIINDSHKADECHHLSPVLKRFSGGFLTGQWVQNSVVCH